MPTPPPAPKCRNGLSTLPADSTLSCSKAMGRQSSPSTAVSCHEAVFPASRECSPLAWQQSSGGQPWGSDTLRCSRRVAPLIACDWSQLCLYIISPEGWTLCCGKSFFFSSCTGWKCKAHITGGGWFCKVWIQRGNPSSSISTGSNHHTRRWMWTKILKCSALLKLLSVHNNSSFSWKCPGVQPGSAVLHRVPKSLTSKENRHSFSFTGVIRTYRYL